MSAFLHYLSERRVELKKSHPNLGHKEIVSKLSEDWRSIQISERKIYEKKAGIDRERYEKEKKEFKLRKQGVKPKKKNPKIQAKEKVVAYKKRGRHVKPGTARVLEGTAVI